MTRFALLFLLRDLRSGELRLLALALLIAVAAVTSVGFFVDRVRLAMANEAHQLLGADLLLISDHPWPKTVRDKASSLGLRIAETQVFPSMVSNASQFHLADVKAVSLAYPMRGELRITSVMGTPDRAAQSVPDRGEVWLDERLATALGSRVGDALTLGQSAFRVGAILTVEPDRGVNFFSVAPRLMMHLDDLPDTRLIQVGSRVAYRLLLAGQPQSVASFRDWVNPQLKRGERVEDAQNVRPEIRTVLERAQRFLGLASLLTVVLAAVAVALAARRYMQRHLDTCAVMRCFGATQGVLIRLHFQQFLALAVLAAGLGCVLGYAAHFALNAWLAELLAVPLPPPSMMPVGQGALTAGILLFGFAFPPLLRLARVPTLRVIRRELGAPQASFLGGYALGLALLAGLMLWVAGDLALGGYAVAGFAIAAFIFVIVARVAVKASSTVRGAGRFGWRQGLASLERHAWASTVQIVALALGLLAMLLLTVTRTELMAAWQRATPADAPNRFVFNMQADQLPAINQTLRAAGVAINPSPMVRGRLNKIRGRAVDADDFPEDDRAQRLIEREFNLSWKMELPPGNRVVEGRWFLPEERGVGVASVEQGLAKTLGIKVGDQLEFTINGESVPVRVVGLRKLDWDSMRVNFFVLTPPGVIDGYPASYISSFHLPTGQEDVTHQLVERFPNLTVIDVGVILRQLQGIMAQVAQAVQFIFIFTLAAGGVVLYAALVTAFDERRYELSVMRALGARKAQLRQALLTELTAIGALAGLIAGCGAALIGQVLASRVFQLTLEFNIWLLPGAALAGASLSLLLGWLGMRNLLQTPPMLALRAGQ